MSLRERSARPGSPADWRDVTSLFSEAADAMETGQLVHVASFDLFRTMSALDIGDPQTDSGCSCHLENTKTLRQRLTDGDVELRSCLGLFRSQNASAGADAGVSPTATTLSPSIALGTFGVVAIVDTLLAYEVDYHGGQQDVQTILTCFYTHGPVLAKMRKELFETCKTAGRSGTGVPATTFFRVAQSIPLAGVAAEKGASDPHCALSPQEVAELSAAPYQFLCKSQSQSQSDGETSDSSSIAGLQATPESAPMLA